MKLKNYKKLIYLITATIIATIAMQVYWNVQNYKTNKQRLINEVQISLDNGVEAYYADIAKTDIRAFISHDVSKKSNRNFIKDVFKTKESKSFFDALKHKRNDTVSNKPKVEISEITFNDVSFSEADSITSTINNDNVNGIQIFSGHKADSIRNLTGLTNKIIISMNRDTIDFNKLDEYFSQELDRKKIACAMIISMCAMKVCISTICQRCSRPLSCLRVIPKRRAYTPIHGACYALIASVSTTDSATIQKSLTCLINCCAPTAMCHYSSSVCAERVC